MDIVFRAYNEGVAFRYSLPKQDALGEFTIAAENTGFYFARDAHAYAMRLGSFTKEYEKEFERTELDDYKSASIVALPMLVELAGGPYVALLEADLTDYAGMYLSKVNGVSNALMSCLSLPLGVSGFSLGFYYQQFDGLAELEAMAAGFYKYVIMGDKRKSSATYFGRCCYRHDSQRHAVARAPHQFATRRLDRIELSRA